MRTSSICSAVGRGWFLSMGEFSALWNFHLSDSVGGTENKIYGDEDNS